jgi:hypothetical protein
MRKRSQVSRHALTLISPAVFLRQNAFEYGSKGEQGGMEPAGALSMEDQRIPTSTLGRSPLLTSSGATSKEQGVLAYVLTHAIRNVNSDCFHEAVSWLHHGKRSGISALPSGCGGTKSSTK